ncbi:MAG: SUMF1/EgtB/PvdO family nonheme iron enzyme [Bacillota bacterium]|nr:SUMF1/EgtB/PvdO family nonheme iron enzyme [Bacillota bacterium]
MDYRQQRTFILKTIVLITILLFKIALIGCSSDKHVAPDMILVKAGSFKMGDEIGDLWDGTKPVHAVTFTYDYWVGKYPVTFNEYDDFCRSTERNPAYDHGWGREDRPVIHVNWWDAVAYCNWLSEQEKLKPAYSQDGELLDVNGEVTTDITKVEGYRLLTDAEWEYAASGGHEALPTPPRFLYAGSDDIDEVAWYFNNSGDEWKYTGSSLQVDYSRHGATLYEGKSTQPVGQKMPNELGIYDMSGNVWEWCHDYYDLYPDQEVVNPVGALTGHVRVMRGGSWIFGANDCRVACRFYRSPHDKIYRLGFRVARTDIN